MNQYRSGSVNPSFQNSITGLEELDDDVVAIDIASESMDGTEERLDAYDGDGYEEEGAGDRGLDRKDMMSAS